MTKVVGITGGIGSGKTTLSKHLKKIGLPVHESDKVVLNMYNKPNKPFIDFMKKNLSKEVILKGKINKKRIANIIFNNDKAKNRLEKYIHKEVRVFRENFIKKNLKTKKKIIFVDIPLLLENKLEKKFDLIVCIISTKKNRTKRVLKNRKFSKQILNKIFRAQTTDKERRARSHIIINNNKTKKDFIFNAEQALTRILK
jgi:dephospho-CoA kinase